MRLMQFRKDWTLLPLQGANDVRFGMSEREVSRRMGLEGQRDVGNTNLVYWNESAVRVDFQPTAHFMEFCDGVGMSVQVFGIDVFKTPAAELIAKLVSLGHEYDADEPELGYCYTFRELQLGLWRPSLPDGPDDDDGRHFATVGIGVTGYY